MPVGEPSGRIVPALNRILEIRGEKKALTP